MSRKIQLQVQTTKNTLALTEQESSIDDIFKVKTVYSEAAIQSSYKNYHFGNFGEIIVRCLKFRCTAVKMPSHNFQFRTGANLNYFIFDEKR